MTPRGALRASAARNPRRGAAGKGRSARAGSGSGVVRAWAFARLCEPVGGASVAAGARARARPDRDAALAALGHDRVTLARDLVHAGGAVDDPGALGAETDQRLGDPLHPAAIEDADHLAADTRRIGE